MRIFGNTVGTTLPKPNLDQTDPKKGDFIKGDRSFTKGDPGAVFVPSLDEAGNLSWSNDGGLPNPPAVNIMGQDGYTPVRGQDYYTDADKLEMADTVLGAIPLATHISVDRKDTATTMTLTLSDGSQSVVRIEYDEGGDPAAITLDGNSISLEFIDYIKQLFATGDVCEEITGGWAANNYTKGSVTESKTPTLDVTGDMVISLATDKNSAQGSVMTVNTVTVPGFKKLCFNVKSLGAGGKVTFGIVRDAASSYTLERPVEASVGLNVVDVSDWDSTRYTVAIAVTAYQNATTTVVIDSIYLE